MGQYWQDFVLDWMVASARGDCFDWSDTHYLSSKQIHHIIWPLQEVDAQQTLIITE